MQNDVQYLQCIRNQRINENLNRDIKRILGAEEAVGLNLNKHKTHQRQILPHNVAMYIYEPAQKKKRKKSRFMN